MEIWLAKRGGLVASNGLGCGLGLPGIYWQTKHATASSALSGYLAPPLQLPDGAVPNNLPLPRDSRGMPVYSGSYAVLPMLQHPQGEVVFIMAFSGGGKRSAAFAHGCCAV